MIRACILLAFVALSGFSTTNTIFDLTVQDGTVYPTNVVPTVAQANILRGEVLSFSNSVATALQTAVSVSNRAEFLKARFNSLASDGLFYAEFTYPRIGGVASGEDIESEAVAFDRLETPSNYVCRIWQWYATALSDLPDWSATFTTNLTVAFSASMFEHSSTWPTPVENPSANHLDTGVVYLNTLTIPKFASCFFKLSPGGLTIRGNLLPIIGGLSLDGQPGKTIDIPAEDIDGNPVILNFRNGGLFDLNNPIPLNSYSL